MGIADYSGDAATFTVAASGVPNPAFQWYFDGTALTGATNATLTLMNFTTTNLGTYDATVTNN
jgi:hypothetical protein